MLFNSLTFFAFFAVVYALYRVSPHRLQNALLLTASYVFYGSWDWRFLSLIVLSTAIDYVAGLRIFGARAVGDQRAARAWLAASAGLNLGILGLFKYFDFFSQSLASLLATIGLGVSPLLLDLALPVGISFYTFQTMSYTIDVYRKRIEPTRSIADFALFVAFFPQLMAGPIERAKRLLPQLQRPRNIERWQVEHGVWLVCWGLFQKVFIADGLLAFTRWGFDPRVQHSSLEVYLLAVASAVRVYCDFSGYSDMARGLARLLGIEISRNFDRPFLAESPAEFWRRWHMTLTQWLTDYLYIPLRRLLIDRGLTRGDAIVYATFATFLMMGLWHGARWGYVAWGAFWGVVMVLHHELGGKLGRSWLTTGRIGTTLARLCVFHLFAFSLLFIMGPLESAAGMFRSLLVRHEVSDVTLSHAVTMIYYTWPIAIFHFSRRWSLTFEVDDSPPAGMQVAGYGIMSLCLFATSSMQSNEFVYFQF